MRGGITGPILSLKLSRRGVIMKQDRRQRQKDDLKDLLRLRGISTVLFNFLDYEEIDRFARSWDRETWSSMKAHVRLESPADAPAASLPPNVDYRWTWVLRAMGLPDSLAARLGVAELKAFATAYDRELWKELRLKVERAIIKKRGPSSSEAKRLSEDPRNLVELERRLAEQVISKHIASGSSTSVNPVYLGKYRPSKISTGHPGTKG